MNIELDEAVAYDVSDDALEMAAGGAQAGNGYSYSYRVASCDVKQGCH